MVCPRCLSSVKNILEEQKIGYKSIELGKVELTNDLSVIQKSALSQLLKVQGFELLDNEESKMVSSIKAFIVDKIHYHNSKTKNNLSDELSNLLHKDYSIISKTFSRLEGMTIEHFLLYQRIEKAKELISYEEMTIAEIAFDLEYSSSAHLSSQFKQITGMSPSEFKKLSNKTRISLNDI